MQLDDALTALGAYGRYQVFVYLAISTFDNLPSIWHMSAMTFLGFEPQHHCKVPEGANTNKTITVKYDAEGVAHIDKCNMFTYANGSYANSTVPCTDGWYYDPDPVKTSVVTEWDLVCDRNVLPETSVMVFNFGVMFGAILFGFLSDKFGRKKSFISALILQAIIGSTVAAATNFYVFMVLRFFVGAMEQGVNITGFIMATELFPPKQRTIMAVTHEFLWAGGGAILPIFAYFLRDWRPLQLCVSIPSILGIGLIWMIPESLVWLVCKGKYKEAEEILQKAAKMNGKELPENCLTEQESTKPILTPDGGPPSERSVASSVHHKKTYTIIDLFRYPALRKITICTCILWAVNTMVYYGLSYNTPNLPGSMYVNFFIGQMVEIPSVAFTMWIIYRFGRRWPLCLSHVFGGIVCIASPFIPLDKESGVDLNWLAITLAMLGKFSINCSFTIIYIYGPEIYPTVLRNTGTGVGSFSGRIGGILYPYINYLSKVDSKFSKQLPLLVFGVLSVIGGFMALPLPETRHHPLPETIEDVENYTEFCKKAQQRKEELKNGGVELNHIVDRKNSNNGNTPTAV